MHQKKWVLGFPRPTNHEADQERFACPAAVTLCIDGYSPDLDQDLMFFRYWFFDFFELQDIRRAVNRVGNRSYIISSCLSEPEFFPGSQQADRFFDPFFFCLA